MADSSLQWLRPLESDCLVSLGLFGYWLYDQLCEVV